MKSEHPGRPVKKNEEEGAAAMQEYEKPAFRCERVFETMALACGKIGPTQQQCKFNRKTS